MTAYSAIANSEIAVGAPLTNSLMTKNRDNPLAIQENDATAPTIAFATSATSATTAGTITGQIDPSSQLNDTITTEGSQSIVALATWTPPQGIYNMVTSNSNEAVNKFSIYTASAWRNSGDNGTGMMIFDGANMRIYNGGGTTYTTYWQRFDG